MYSIAIFENFNRPFIFRKLENFYAKNTSGIRTLGIMQVTTNRIIDDTESVRLGIEIICDKFYKDITENTSYCSIIGSIIYHYNPSYDYQQSVNNIFNILSEELYGNNIHEEWREQIKNLNDSDELD